MTTYRELVGNISSTIRQVNKDRKIEPFEILYWILVFAAKLRSQHITNAANRNDWISGEFITEFIVNIKQIVDKRYFDLPAAVMNYKSREGGIDFVTYNLAESGDIPDIGNNQFTRVSASQVTRLYYNVHEEPTPSNPYFYRIGDRVFLLGLEKTRVKTLNAGLVLGVSIDDIESLDEVIRLPDHLISVLMMQILQLAQFGMAMPDVANNDQLKNLREVAQDEGQ